MLDELRKLLASHLHHVNAQPNQGTVRLVEDHLQRLDAAAGAGADKADAEAHAVLSELYGALNAPASTPTTASKPAAKKAVDSTPSA